MFLISGDEVNMLRTIVVIIGIVFAALSTFVGLLGGLFAQDLCTGTGSLVYRVARVCSAEFTSYVWLFSVFNLILLLGLIILSYRKKSPPLIRYIALGIFAVYGSWLILSSSAIWVTSFFTDPLYPPGV